MTDAEAKAAKALWSKTYNSRPEVKEANRLRMQRYRAENPEKTKQSNRDAYARHAESRRQLALDNYYKNWQERNEYRAAYYLRKRVKLAEKRKTYKAKYPDRIRLAAAKYRIGNRDKLNLRRRQWGKANRDVVLFHNSNRRAARLGVNGSLSKGLALKLFTLQRGRCPCCKRPLGSNAHMDHKMPLHLGGQHVDGNMQLLRAQCNLQKHTKHPVDFMQERGFLL